MLLVLPSQSTASKFSSAEERRHNLRNPAKKWAVRMGMQSAKAAASDTKPTTGTKTALSMEIYADAVAAVHVPKCDHKMGLRAQNAPEGRVITLKDETEYDNALRAEPMRSKTEFATVEVQYQFDATVENPLSVNASTLSVQVQPCH